MDSIYAIGGYYEEFMKEYDFEDDLIFTDVLTWEVAFGCLNHFEFAKNIRNNEKIIKCNELMRILTTCYVINDIIDDEMIKKYPPYHLTYPKIISDQTFDKLLESYSDILRIPLSVIAIIKNREDVFLKLDPDACLITYSFAIQYNRTKCLNQQKIKSEKRKGYSNECLFIRNENIEYKPYIFQNQYQINTKLYLEHYVMYNRYMYGIYPEHFDEDCVGTLGLDYIDMFGNFGMATLYEFKNIKINENLYYDPVQVSYVYNNLEKFDEETCRTAISKLILSEKKIDQKIINKYKPYDLSKELSMGYWFIEENYPSLTKELNEAKNKYMPMIDGSVTMRYLK